MRATRGLAARLAAGSGVGEALGLRLTPVMIESHVSVLRCVFCVSVEELICEMSRGCGGRQGCTEYNYSKLCDLSRGRRVAGLAGLTILMRPDFRLSARHVQGTSLQEVQVRERALETTIRLIAC